MRVSFSLNGSEVVFDASPGDVLLDVLRREDLTDTKEGCGVGVCGVCTVLVDDAPVSSCLLLAGCLEGRRIWTARGLCEREPGLAKAFVDSEAMQCGICTPGQVVTAEALRRQGGGTDETAVRTYLAGNLCRCTGYGTIVEAVMRYLRSL